MITSVSQLRPTTGDPDIDQRFAFREAIDANRDQWGRPKIMLPDGSREVGYRRASSYGAPLEDSTQLEKWKLRQVARGLARRPDMILAVTRAEVGLDGPWDVAKKSKTELNNIAEAAMDVVESGAKASIGTSLHDVCELIDLGRDPGHIPEPWRPDIDAYRELSRGFRMLSIERFVVQDEHQVAGTTDRVVEAVWPLLAPDGTVIEPGSVMIGDLKTAQDMTFAGCKFAVQCWVYATGEPYNPIEKVRIPWGHEPPRTDWAVILHVPSGQGTAELHWVNLTEAAEAAEDARRVYAWRNRRGKALITRGVPGEDFTVTCSAATTLDQLLSAHRRAVAVGAWNDVLKQRFSKRRREIEGTPV